MDAGRLAAGWERIFAALGMREHDAVRRRVDHALTDDGRVRLDRAVYQLDPSHVAVISSTQIETANPTAVSLAANLETQVQDIADAIVANAITAVDSASIDFTQTVVTSGQELTAVAIFGSTAGTVAEGNHTHTLTATATLDFASIAAQSCGELTITVTGAAVGDAVALGPPAALEAGLSATGYVSAANTITVRLCCVLASAVDPVSATWRATALRP